MSLDDYNAPTQLEPATPADSQDYDYMQRFYAGEDLNSDPHSTDPYTHSQPQSYNDYDKYEQRDSYAHSDHNYANFDSYDDARDVPINYETHPYDQ